MVDLTFDPTRGGALRGIEGAFPTPWLRGLALEPDGRVYVGGDFSSINGQPRAGLARLLPNGSLDPSYQPPWTNGANVSALARQPDGKLLVLWRSSIHNDPAEAGGGVTRLNFDGGLDASFTNYWSFQWVPSVACLALLADGKFLVGGEFVEPRAGVARFNSDGTLDETFTPPLLPAYDGTTVNAIVVQPDGRILVGGSYGIGLLRLNPDGSCDETFVPELEVGGSVNAIQLQPDGRVLVGGSLDCSSGQELHNVVRLQSDGTLDPSFSAVVGMVPHALALQADGRILAAGECWQQPHDVPIHRLNRDGSTDTSFQACADIWYGWPHVAAMLVQPDNRIVMAGTFTNVNAWPAVAIARLEGGPLISRVVAWGETGPGQCDVPLDLANAAVLGGGAFHSITVKTDGSTVTWGGNEFGQRGVPAGLTNAAALAVGPFHTLAVTRNGTVVAWGDPSASRTEVPEGLSNVIAVAAGALHSLALRDDGTVVCWGSNLDQNDEYAGQATVPPGLVDVVAIAAGDYHSVAVRADGSVVACQ